MANKKFSVKDITAAAAFVIVLGASSILGMKEREHAAGQQSAPVRSEQEIAGAKGSPGAIAPGSQETGPVPTAGGGRNTSREAAADSQTGIASRTAVPVLDQKQTALVGQIMEAFRQGDLEQAARMMSQEEETLLDMFYTTMNGMRYFYDGENLSQEIDGQGMVFTKAGTVFYGSFQAGKPEGQCTALQVVNLDAPRYDYSEGIWKDGQMDGPGHTGYCYYEGSPEGEARDICKAGTFSGDFMDGEVDYTSMNKEDGTAAWKLTVDHGAVVLDDRWRYEESAGEYQLLSENDDNHAYVVGEGQITLPVWKNLLVWEE